MAKSTLQIDVGPRASLFRRFTDTNVSLYGTSSVKISKTQPQNIPMDIRIFFTVYCIKELKEMR